MSKSIEKGVEIFCETSCRGKESFYCGILSFNGEVKRLFCLAEENVDHNLMEMKSMIHGFEILKLELEENDIKGSCVDVYISSQNIIKAFSEKWIDNWNKKNWINSKGKPVKYKEEWESIEELVSVYSPRLIHSSKYKRKENITIARKNAKRITRRLSKKV